MRLIPLTVGRENAELTMIAFQCFLTEYTIKTAIRRVIPARSEGACWTERKNTYTKTREERKKRK